jgi:hypothetical protein
MLLAPGEYQPVKKTPKDFVKNVIGPLLYAFPNIQIELVGKIIAHLVILGLVDLASSVTLSQDIQGGVVHQGRRAG